MARVQLQFNHQIHWLYQTLYDDVVDLRCHEWLKHFPTMIHSSISFVIDISDSTANIIFKLFYFHTVESCIDGWFSFYFLDTLYTRKWVFILLFIVIVIHFHTVMVNDTKQAIILVLFTSFLSLSYVVC